MDVIDPGSDLMRLLGRDGRSVQADLQQARWDRLEALAAPFRAAGVPVRTSVEQGTGFIEVIRMVLKEGHDLVMKGADAAPGAVFTGVDMHLMRKCPVPVWIMKDETTPKVSRVLAAVDPDPQDPVRDALNHMVMDLGTSLAARDGADLHVVNVWRLQEEHALRTGRFRMKPAEVDALVGRAQTLSRERLDALIADYDIGPADCEIAHLKGIAGDVIPDYLATHDIDTIITGTIGRTGVSGFFIGNTAETILSRVTCSVIALKPQGFTSPVQLEPGAL
jgi:nucleotide-binding universal stress UspA family protein